MKIKCSKILIVLLSFTFVNSLSAQNASNTYQDIWLINIPTPFTLNKDDIQLDIFARYTNYRDERTGVRELLLFGTYGLTNNLSLSFITPISDLGNNLNDIELGDMSLLLKYRVFNSKYSNIALSPIISFPTGSEQNLLGTGKVNFQLRFYLGYQKNRINLFANLGYGERGYVNRKTRLNPSGSTSIIYSMRNEQAFTFSGGLAFHVRPKVTFILEGIGQLVPEFSDRDFYFQIGGILQIKKAILLRGGGGIGLPHDSRTIIDSRITLGLSYLIN